MQIGRALSAMVLAAGLPGFASASPAQHMAECVAATRDMPTLDSRKLPGARFRLVTEPIGWASGEQIYLRHGVETAALPGGVGLRVDLGGCEDYANTYIFTLPQTGPSPTNGAYWFRRARDLISQVEPANTDTALPLKVLADALARKAEDPNAGRALVSGIEGVIDEASQTIYLVTLEQKAGRAILTVTYGIHL